MAEETPKQKIPPDRLPGTFDKRVFIGGNYDNIGILRKIKKIVADLNLDLVPILPRDDISVPLQEVHDWDLRILHTCRYAIFDVSSPAGEMMEIERVRDYATQALLVYQSREDGPPSHITKMVQTVKLPLQGYNLIDEDLPKIVREFFSPAGTPLAEMETYLSVVGCCYSRVSNLEEIQKTGLIIDTTRYEGLRASGKSPVTLMEHGRELSSGEIIDVKFNLVVGDPNRVKWTENRKNQREFVGEVTINPPLKKGEPEISYELVIKSRGGYCLTKDEFKERYPHEPKILEWSEMKILYPMTEYVKTVKFYQGYPFQPEFAIYYGAYRDVDAETNPMVQFTHAGSEEAVLKVTWPKPLHRYLVSWIPADLA